MPLGIHCARTREIQWTLYTLFVVKIYSRFTKADNLRKIKINQRKNTYVFDQVISSNDFYKKNIPRIKINVKEIWCWNFKNIDSRAFFKIKRRYRHFFTVSLSFCILVLHLWGSWWHESQHIGTYFIAEAHNCCILSKKRLCVDNESRWSIR